ncbi:hypothetical protein BT67DRAFT_428085 [Trichocladium antarcticum]|uniref:CCZ1/INTU/HSP4 first Longin domain-containing protein n=1 Tax=Trichocladium antarcticum TaxID=1450529 RepID=A0AAN6ZAT6_9PEZI|nr:hypothetical protein BT67DRAFT_428085 [Trichocladium antarcticum]
MTAALASGIVPAQLGFLAIYNPSLGTTDETVDDQIVYYASVSTQSQKRRRHRAGKDGRPIDAVSKDERNERLRQIGLAQGMVEFAKGFADGTPVDAIDTEHSRVVLHELEPGWWILAVSEAPPTARVEYSSREVKPPALLRQDLLRAHALFLLHHAPPRGSLSALLPLLARDGRARCAARLARHWDRFLATWDVLLHGNPAGAVFGGITMAACGALGIGVGEEARGSGERDVLEGLVGRVDGLVDVVVGRFGEPAAVFGGGGESWPGKGTAAATATGLVDGRAGEDGGWLGAGSEVGAEDGAVFLGAGALSRNSVRAVTYWMEDIFRWGESAYGVTDGPREAGSRPKRRAGAGRRASTAQTDGEPRLEKGQSGAVLDAGARDQNDDGAHRAAEDQLAEAGETGGGLDRIFGYLKMGYGTSWSLGASGSAALSDTDKESTPGATDTADGAGGRGSSKHLRGGRFLIGLDDESSETGQPGQPDATASRAVVVNLEVDAQAHLPPGAKAAEDPSDTSAEPDITGETTTSPYKRTREKMAQLRPVIYANRPFIYILLFQPTTPSPESWDELSHTLSTQLAALQKPLLTSTSYRPAKPLLSSPAAEIYDLVFDPVSLTIHSTIPNIPDPGPPHITTPGSTPASPIWTRVEALSTHSQILGMVAGTRADAGARERTCKTGRGWWVVWSRVADEHAAAGAAAAASSSPSSCVGGSDAGDADRGSCPRQEQLEGRGKGGGVGGKEIVLVRRASDHGGGGGGGGGGARRGSASYVGGAGMMGMGSGGGWADGASRLAQGIGVDTRRYIDGLLSLDR